MTPDQKIGVFGIGPGSVAAIDRLRPSTLFVKEGGAERRSIYTTSDHHEALFRSYVDPQALLPMRQIRGITSHGTDFTLETREDYYMVDYPRLQEGWSKQAAQQAQEVVTLPQDLKKDDIRVFENDGSIRLNIQGGNYEFDSLVDSTGTAAVIASQVEPTRAEENFLAEYVCAGTFRGRVPDGQITLVFGPAGGSSWVNPSIYQEPNGEPLVDVVFSAWEYRSRFQHFRNGDGLQRLHTLVDFVNGHPGIEIHDPNPQDITYGIIRAQRTPRPLSQTVYATGEAGGTAKPYTGESFNRALASGAMAAESIANGETPGEYYDTYWNKYRDHDVFFSMAHNRLGKQAKGKIGYVVDELGKYFEGHEGDQKVISQFEQFFMGGRTPKALLTKLLVNPTFLSNIVKTVGKLAVVKSIGPEKMHTASYSLPPLEAGA